MATARQTAAKDSALLVTEDWARVWRIFSHHNETLLSCDWPLSLGRPPYRYSEKEYGINLGSWEPAHLPLPYFNVNICVVSQSQRKQPFTTSTFLQIKDQLATSVDNVAKSALELINLPSMEVTLNQRAKMKAPQSWQRFADVCTASGKFVPLTIQTAVKFRDFEEANLR